MFTPGDIVFVKCDRPYYASLMTGDKVSFDCYMGSKLFSSYTQRDEELVRVMDVHGTTWNITEDCISYQLPKAVSQGQNALSQVQQGLMQGQTLGSGLSQWLPKQQQGLMQANNPSLPIVGHFGTMTWPTNAGGSGNKYYCEVLGYDPNTYCYDILCLDPGYRGITSLVSYSDLHSGRAIWTPDTTAPCPPPMAAGAAPLKRKCSVHRWKNYVGLTEVYDFCEDCDEKRPVGANSKVGGLAA